MPPKKSAKSTRASGNSRGNSGARLYGPGPVVSLAWLMGAAATAVAIGALGAYLVLCLLFYQNQAMLIFHPSRKISLTPASEGLEYQAVALDRTKAGTPQLTGWWIPAAKNARYLKDTILYLHGASGSLSDAVGQIKALHALGITIFALDYRGFGDSADLRPTEQSADADALVAWQYLTVNRKIPPTGIIVFGQGAGASFATHLAARRTIAGLVLAEISPTARTIFEHDQRARLLPLFLLANQRMDPGPELMKWKGPKLFIDRPDKSTGGQTVTRHDYTIAAPPRQLASLPGATLDAVANAVQPFLQQVLPPAH